MTLAEILKQNGVAEDTIRAIQNDMKTAKLFTTGEENADIRLGKLKGEHESVRQQLEAAQQKIAALEADKAEHSGSQEKMDEMHRQLEAAQAALQKSRMDAAIHIALMRGGASDIDYMTWVLQQKGDALTLDDKGNIDGWENTLASLKKKYPNQFEASGKKNIIENRLPDQEGHAPLSRSEILKKPYAERQKIFEENPEAFRAAMAAEKWNLSVIATGNCGYFVSLSRTLTTAHRMILQTVPISSQFSVSDLLSLACVPAACSAFCFFVSCFASLRFRLPSSFSAFKR